MALPVPPRRIPALRPAGWLLLAVIGLPAAGAAEAATAPAYPAVRAEDLIAAINGARAARGAPPLRPVESLARYAEERVRLFARHGALTGPAGVALSTAERTGRLKAAGYDPHAVSELAAQVRGDAAAVLRDWQQAGRDTFDELLRSEFRDIGVASAARPGGPAYVVVLGLDWADAFAERTAMLRDRERVVEEMTRRVNEERRARRRPPLRYERRLDRAAQAYADRMLRDGFYAHTAPEGDTVLERARAASYFAAAVAENLAVGPTSVEEVIEGWMGSEGHRRNLLDPGFRDFGMGLALGRDEEGWKAIWVQVFGLPRRADVP